MTKKRLTRRKWLEEAYRTLLRRGRDGLRVEVLARSLGVTKGSFYWHFKDLDDLLRSLLEDWSVTMTERIRTEVAAAQGSASQRLLLLMQGITKRRLTRHDAEIRAWASYDKLAARHVRQVDHVRLSFLRGLFTEMGFRDLEADVRARMVMYFHVAEATIRLREKTQDRDAHLRARHRLLVAGAPNS